MSEGAADDGLSEGAAVSVFNIVGAIVGWLLVGESVVGPGVGTWVGWWEGTAVGEWVDEQVFHHSHHLHPVVEDDAVTASGWLSTRNMTELTARKENEKNLMLFTNPDNKLLTLLKWMDCDVRASEKHSAQKWQLFACR